MVWCFFVLHDWPNWLMTCLGWHMLHLTLWILKILFYFFLFKSSSLCIWSLQSIENGKSKRANWDRSLCPPNDISTQLKAELGCGNRSIPTIFVCIFIIILVRGKGMKNICIPFPGNRKCCQVYNCLAVHAIMKISDIIIGQPPIIRLTKDTENWQS